MDKRKKRSNGPLQTSARCLAVLSCPQDIELLLGGIYRCKISKEQLTAIDEDKDITIGAHECNDIVVTDAVSPHASGNRVNELHCFIIRKEAFWIYDASETGTLLVLGN